MNPDAQTFIARNVINIVIVLIYGIRVLFVSNASLRIKFVGLLMLSSVFYLGRLVTQSMLGQETSVVWYFAVYIGVRLIALKIIFMVIDYEG